jgi:hypothetical protein
MLAALALVAIAATWVLLILQVDPVPTWFYVFAWYPTLVVLDRAASRMSRRPPLLSTRSALALFAWSPIIWLLFEAANFRLRNWYYVFLPDAGLERWIGIVLSFATVLPALVLATRLLQAAGVGREWHTRPLPIKPWHLVAIQMAGIVMGLLALIQPRVFFPLIWGAAWLIFDPFVYRRNKEWSLMHDIERGMWGRIVRVMLGGLLIGIIWEFLNFWARGRWIYTVPWLEHTKLFEMPPLGFVGFPLFALEAWALYHALCAMRVAVPPGEKSPQLPRARLASAAVAALLFATLVLGGMERWTISSTAPHIAEVPGLTPDDVTRLEEAGLDSPFRVARSTPATLSRQAGIHPAGADRVVKSARLVTLRGIGNEHARALHGVGATTVCGLARRSPLPLWRAVHEARAEDTARPRESLGDILPPSGRPTEAEVRVWVGAARRACARRFLVTRSEWLPFPP